MSNKLYRALSYLLVLIPILILSSCEGKMVFIIPDEPEKLSVLAIIDADDTNKRIEFEKSYQQEYPQEEKDSLRELSFSISAGDSNMFEYSNFKSLKNKIPIIIPGNMSFVTGKEYFFKAKEKDTKVILSQIKVPYLPPDFSIDSMKKIVYINNNYPNWANPAMKIKLIISIKENYPDISYFTLLIEGSNNYFPKTDGYIDYSVLNSEIPWFTEIIPEFRTSHLAIGSIEQPSAGTMASSASFFEVRKGNSRWSSISISFEMGGDEIYDYKKPVRIRLLSIPEELYNFEKSLNNYWNSWHDPFREPVYLNSNIKNGYGIFAICRSKEITVSLPWK